MDRLFKSSWYKEPQSLPAVIRGLLNDFCILYPNHSVYNSLIP